MQITKSKVSWVLKLICHQEQQERVLKLRNTGRAAREGGRREDGTKDCAIAGGPSIWEVQVGQDKTILNLVQSKPNQIEIIIFR